MNIFERLWFRAKTGSDIRVVNGGNPVEPVVIHYKGFYFEVMMDSETGEPTGDFSWSDDPTMFHVPIREILNATENPAYDESKTGNLKDSLS